MKAKLYTQLPTEQRNSHSTRLDQISTRAVLALMNKEDAQVLKAVRAALPQIARACAEIVTAWRRGGHLILVGAGTSGRLAVLEAAECPPTFNTSPDQVQALMAGGAKAVFRSQEGAEDSQENARRAIAQHARRGDVVLGIAASGVTPFVGAALQAAQKKGAVPMLLTCNPQLARVKMAKIVIALNTGPEVLTGSTRLKAGSACKMVLNMLTTAAFVRVGKTYGNRMVDLQPKSQKLIARSLRLVQELGRVGEKSARDLLEKSAGEAKTAIVMARLHCSAQEARRKLKKANGFLREVIG